MRNFDPENRPFLDFPFLPFRRTEWKYLRLPNFRRIPNFNPNDPKYTDIRNFRRDLIPVIVPEENPIAAMLRQDLAGRIPRSPIYKPLTLRRFLEVPRTHPNNLYIEPNNYLLIPSGSPTDPSVASILTYQENIRLQQQSQGICGMVGVSRRVLDEGRLSFGVKLTQTREPNRPISPSVMVEFEYSLDRWLLEDTSVKWRPFFKISTFKLPREASVRWGFNEFELEFQLNPHVSCGIATNHGDLASIFDFQDIGSIFKDHMFIGLSRSRAIAPLPGTDCLLTTKMTTKIFLSSVRGLWNDSNVGRLLNDYFSTESSPSAFETSVLNPPLKKLSLDLLEDTYWWTEDFFLLTQTFLKQLPTIVCSYAFMIRVGNFVVVSLISIASFSVYIFVISLQSRVKNSTYRQLLSLLQFTLSPFFPNAFAVAGAHVAWNILCQRDIFYKVKGFQKVIHYAQITSGKAPEQLIVFGKDALPGLSITFSALTAFLTLVSIKRVVIFISQDVNVKVWLCGIGSLVLTFAGKSYLYQWSTTEPKEVTD